MIDLSISQKTVADVFKDLKTKKFIIPAYQRPYRWDEECSVLWDDIYEFFKSTDEDDDYFLGTIVTYVNADRDKEVIDGQQRLTSLLLLLRAFYTKLEQDDENDEEVKGLKKRINPIIWSDINEMTQEVNDKEKRRIFSAVATDESNEIFHEILSNGEVEPSDKNNLYYKNYKFFCDKCNEFAMTKPLQWKNFCLTILNKCVILPIDCPKWETALRIFSTLNDRGMPLEDSDIFKAEIYKSFNTPDEQKKFIDEWQEFSSVCERADVKIDDVFRMYMHILRTQKEETDSEVALRKFFQKEENKSVLRDENIISHLYKIADFWQYLNNGEDKKSEDITFTLTNNSWKWIDCLRYFSNEYWRYPIIVYYYFNDSSAVEFSCDFEKFLKKILSFVLVKFILSPTVTTLKHDVYKLNIAVNKDKNHDFVVSASESDIVFSIENGFV
jgi:uncharacterized protein with ParB-like and HNH nuclease domain